MRGRHNAIFEWTEVLSIEKPTIFDKVLVSFYGPFSSLLQSKIIELNLQK